MIKMTEMIVTGAGPGWAPENDIAAAEIQEHADKAGLGGVRPDCQQRVQFRHTAKEVIVQRRGPFWFAYSGECTFGPASSRQSVALQAVT